MNIGQFIRCCFSDCVIVEREEEPSPDFQPGIEALISEQPQASSSLRQRKVTSEPSDLDEVVVLQIPKPSYSFEYPQFTPPPSPQCPYKEGKERYKRLLGLLRLEATHKSKQAENLIAWFKKDLFALPKWIRGEEYSLGKKALHTCLHYKVFKGVEEWESALPYIDPFEWIDFCRTDAENLEESGISQSDWIKLLIKQIKTCPDAKNLFTKSIPILCSQYAPTLALACKKDDTLINRITEGLKNRDSIEGDLMIGAIKDELHQNNQSVQQSD